MFQQFLNENRSVEIAFQVVSLTEVIREIPDGSALALFKGFSIPELSVGLATHEHSSFPEAGELAVKGWDGDASLTIHLNFEGVAVEIAEGPLEFFVLTRRAFKFGDELLIFDLRKKAQVLVGGSERLGQVEVVAEGRPVGRGDDHPRFVIEIVVVASKKKLGGHGALSLRSRGRRRDRRARGGAGWGALWRRVTSARALVVG